MRDGFAGTFSVASEAGNPVDPREGFGGLAVYKLKQATSIVL